MADAAGREPVEVCARRVSVPVALRFGRRRDERVLAIHRSRMLVLSNPVPTYRLTTTPRKRMVVPPETCEIESQ